MSLTRKIIAAHAGVASAEPGEFVEVPVDLVLANDVTAPLAIKQFDRLGKKEVFNRERIALVLDHFTPNRDISSAEQCKLVRDFARSRGIHHFYEGGNGGIEHVILPEKGLIRPMDLIIGADSHTCTYGALGAFATGVGSTDVGAAMSTGKVWLRVPEAVLVKIRGKFRKWVCGKDLVLYLIGEIGVDGATYKALEFAGDGLSSLTIENRLTVANMVVEAGAKNGIFPIDRFCRSYLDSRGIETEEIAVEADKYGYAQEIEVDLKELEPQVALPSLPSNCVPVEEAPRVRIDQVVIGSCTNGRIEDMRFAAEVLQGKRAAEHIRLIVIPGSWEVYKKALREGLIDVFLDAGAVIGPPTCGPCLGGHMGVLASGEKAISTTNRNFVGRMGHPQSEVYLANPAVAAASAITGIITSPWEIV